jgi:hypothetical protein
VLYIVIVLYCFLKFFKEYHLGLGMVCVAVVDLCPTSLALLVFTRVCVWSLLFAHILGAELLSIICFLYLSLK